MMDAKRDRELHSFSTVEKGFEYFIYSLFLCSHERRKAEECDESYDGKLHLDGRRLAKQSAKREREK